jgi:signal transduction histidine kinase
LEDGVRFEVRDTGIGIPREAQELAQDFWTALHGMTDTTLTAGGTLVGLCLAAQSEPVHIGTDDNGRHMYSVNFDMITGR